MFDWKDFLTLSERLLVTAEADDEAAQRTVISRAYYAAYHVAAAFVRAKGILQDRHTHQAVWARLMADPDTERADIGRRGDRMRRTRLDADYRDPFPDPIPQRAQAVVTEARTVIEALERLS